MKRLLTMLAALALPGLAAGQMSQTMPPPPGQRHPAPAANPSSVRQTYEERVRAELDRIEAGIADLVKQASDQRRALPRTVQALSDKADAVEAKLDELTRAGAREWDVMRADVAKSMKELRTEYRTETKTPKHNRAQPTAMPWP